MNDACVLLGKPNVYGSIFRFEGQATVFAYEGGPCYRCLYPEPPPPGLVPSCAEGGVLGILPGTIGLIQATETVKLILGIGEPLVGRLAAVRRAGHEVPRVEAAQESGMPGVRRPSHHHEADRLSAVLRHSQSRSRRSPVEGDIDPIEVKAKIDRGDKFRADRCARAARIPDLQHPLRETDSAGHSCRSVSTNWIAISRSWRTARAACAAPRPSTYSRRTASAPAT